MTEPIVNIFTPTYHPKKEHLTEAIESLLAQTEQNWTLFIHDDASQMDVKMIVKPYLGDPRIKFYKSIVNRGIGGNWNATKKNATAPYIQYLFQDDTWHPEYLERGIKILEHNPSVGFVSLNHTYDAEGEVKTAPAYEKLRHFKEKEISPGLHNGRKFLRWWMERGLHPNVVGEPPFVMFRREVMDKVGPFSEDMPQGLDVDYWIRMLAVSDWYFEPEISGSFRVHPSAASAKNFEEGLGIFDRFRCLELLTKILKGKDKHLAKKALKTQFELMAVKFFEKQKKQEGVKTKGAGKLKGFCAKHPLLVSKALLKAKMQVKK